MRVRHCCAVLLTAAAVLLRKELLLADCDGPVAMPESPEPPLADDEEPLTVAEFDAEVESAPGDGDLGAVSLPAGAAPTPTPTPTPTPPVVGAADATRTPEAGVSGAGAVTGEPRALDSCGVRSRRAPVLLEESDASEPLRKRCSCR